VRPILSLVIDRAVAREPVSEVVALAVAAGVDWIQIRERSLEGEQLLAFAREIAAIARAATPSPEVFVNKRIDIALAIGARGVQLGYDAMSVADARALLGTEASLGVSCHSADDVARAAREGADYVHLAPIFEPKSKPASRPALGLAAIEAAAKHGLPVLAQGGVDAAECARIVRAGAAGVAVTGAILMADDPSEATAQLRDALDSA
jgi:thiamine-phosphate pyrophosphorylase